MKNMRDDKAKAAAAFLIMVVCFVVFLYFGLCWPIGENPKYDGMTTITPADEIVLVEAAGGRLR